MVALSPPSLVGRGRERAILRDQVEAALAGHGSLVLVSGEAGIGKTALCEAVCREAQERGALILVGRCYDLTETPPYGPWIDAFGQYSQAEGTPPLPAAFAVRGTVGAVASQGTLFYQVRDFFSALTTVQPVTLLLDDLHWADPASLDLLRFLSRSLATLPLLLIATHRADELTRRHPLSRVLPLLVRETGAVRLTLNALDDGAVRALVETRYRLAGGDADRLVANLQARAEGNPLFVGEMLRALGETGALAHDGEGWRLGDLTGQTVPILLRQVIEGRAGRLDAESQRLLMVAAVIGQEVPLDVWATVAGVDAEALLPTIEEATAARLIVPTADGATVRFAHALIREALYEGVLPPRRRALHRLAGEALAATPQPDADAVAYHLQRAGDERAVEWLIRAGERAQGAFAWLTAAERYEAAVERMAETGPQAAERAWLFYRISRMRRWENAERSIAYLEEAARAAAQIEDRALAALVRFTRGIVLCHGRNDFVAGVPEVIAGVEAMEALTDDERARLRPFEPTIAAYPRAGLLQTYMLSGRYREVLAIMDGQLEVLHASEREKAPPTSVTGGTGFVLNFVYGMLGDPAAAYAELRADMAHFRATRNNFRLGQMLFFHLYLALTYDADNRALLHQLVEEGEEAFGHADSIGVDHPARALSVPLLMLEGRWTEAVPLAEAAERGNNVVLGLLGWNYSGVLALARGDVVRAWRRVRRDVPGGPETAPGFQPFVHVQQGQRLAVALCLDAGDLDTARQWLAAHDRWLAWSGAVLGQSEGQALWAHYHRQAGNSAQARAHAERALAHAADPRQPLALLAALRLLGELDTEAGGYDAVAPHLDASLALADACHAPYERALTLLALAELRIGTGDREEAARLLAEVQAICEPLDAQPTLARAAALASRVTAAPTAPAVYPAGLSAREVEVLRLVAQGLTNPQVAARLFLSPRTVEQHLRSIYNKLGVSSRAAATAFAVSHDLT